MIADEIRNALHLSEMLHKGEHRTAGPDIGKSYFETHIRRLVAAVPDVAKPAAALHDVLESQENYFHVRVDETRLDVPHLGIPLEPTLRYHASHGALCMTTVMAVRLLTRGSDQSYYAYIDEIAKATGLPGHIARVVKLHDLIDNCATAPHSLRKRYTRAIAMISTAMVEHDEPA